MIQTYKEFHDTLIENINSNDKYFFARIGGSDF